MKLTMDQMHAVALFCADCLAGTARQDWDTIRYYEHAQECVAGAVPGVEFEPNDELLGVLEEMGYEV